MSLPEIRLPFVQEHEAIAKISHSIFNFDIETKTLAKVSPENSNVIFFALSPDKSKIAWIVEEGNKLQVFDLNAKAIVEAGTTEWLGFTPFWKDNNVVCYTEVVHAEKPVEEKRNLIFYDYKEKKSRQASEEINVLLPEKGVKIQGNAGGDGK